MKKALIDIQRTLSFGEYMRQSLEIGQWPLSRCTCFVFLTSCEVVEPIPKIGEAL